MKNKFFPITMLAVLSSACSTQGQIYGTVLPYEDSQYRAISIAGNKSTALKVANNDALVTCQNNEYSSYKIISQDISYNELEQIDTGNKMLDAVANIAAKKEQEENNDAYEITTIFKCK